MARGKLKYKDVVKKPGQPKNKKSINNKSKPVKNNLYRKTKNKPYKRKFDNNGEMGKENIKKPKTEVSTVVESSSESESDAENNLEKLINSFGGNNKLSVAIESSESEMEDDVEDEQSDMEDNGSCAEESDENTGDESVTLNDEIVSNSHISKSVTVENDSFNDDNTEDGNTEDEIDIEIEEDGNENVKDPFVKHVFYELHDTLLESVQSSPMLTSNYSQLWPKLGKLYIQIPKCNIPNEESNEFSLTEKKVYAPPGELPKEIDIKSVKLEDLHIKSQIHKNIFKVNKGTALHRDFIFTPLQGEIFSIINNYQDLYYPQRTFNNAEEIRYIYCLHAVNHILKTRLKVIHHNARLSKRDEVPEEFRDQGLVRPKVLIVVPFKDAAYRIIKLMIDIILPEDKGNVMNKKRFLDDYTGNELILPKKNPKPEDYEHTFQGNSSDDFKIGITVTKKSLKLYANFYSSDIIIASPLGLRTVIGAEGEQERDYDFLASIELLILDQTEIFLMQNWDHVVHIFNHIHLQPKESHGTDFSRVRTWSLNGWAKYYRQTLIFSSLMLPEIHAIFNRKCLNYAGKVKISNPIECGSITQVFVQIPHVFQRFDAQSASDAIDARFNFFISKVLPQQKESLMKQTLIFIPNYFDYVRVRNYFKREDIGFVQICEYSKEGKVARARDMFYHGDAHFLLYTERFHFFNRKIIKGIRHLVFYQLPVFPHFYYEMCNFMQEANMNRKVGNMSNMTVTVIYSKYDIHQLASVVSSERAATMCQSDRKVHLMVTGGD